MNRGTVDLGLGKVRRRALGGIGPRGTTLSRVLLVGKGAPDRGGIPSFLDTLLHSSLQKSHELRFLNVAHTSTPQGGKATVANVARTVGDAVAVWRGAAGQDIVHIHTALAPAVTAVRAGVLAFAARSRGCGVVVHVHGGNVEYWLASMLRRSLVRFALAPAHRVVAVWTAGERALQQALGPDRVRLVDNGVQVDSHRRSDSDSPREVPRVLYVGLLTPRKGVLDLVEASQMLLDQGVAHELWLLGGTPDEGPSAELAVRAGASGRARLLGSRPPEEMPAAYAEVDVFCLPSWWEAMPLSLLEAMASGLPVVATDVGDVSRAVAHGETGFVVPKRSPQELAAALGTLLTDTERRRRMGAAGRARVEERFSSGVTAREMSALYTEVEGERR